jgi:hypothetical protein
MRAGEEFSPTITKSCSQSGCEHGPKAIPASWINAALTFDNIVPNTVAYMRHASTANPLLVYAGSKSASVESIYK